jgi:hypothetical protein
MKKGVPDCGKFSSISLGFEKLVSIFTNFKELVST